jgi:hypothetical protein
MKDLLFRLKKQLKSMLETIENHIELPSDEIMIRKEDLKYLHWRGNSRYGIKTHVFEYKFDVKFRLYEANSYQGSIYEKIMDGSIDRIILNKIQSNAKIDLDNVTHNLEDENETKLRDLYRPIINANQ